MAKKVTFKAVGFWHENEYVRAVVNTLNLNAHAMTIREIVEFACAKGLTETYHKKGHGDHPIWRVCTGIVRPNENNFVANVGRRKRGNRWEYFLKDKEEGTIKYVAADGTIRVARKMAR